MRFSEIRSNSKVTYLTLPHPLDVLPHDLRGVTGALVGRDSVGANFDEAGPKVVPPESNILISLHFFRIGG